MADKEAQKKAQEESRKAMEEQRENVRKENEEAMKRVAESRPTPTQEENDLARVGIHVEQKQDDGSGPEVFTTTTVAGEPLAAHGYPARPRERRARQE